MFHETIKNFYDLLHDQSIWHEIPGSPKMLYTYAEDELYILKDTIAGAIWFFKATSPKKAFEKYMNHVSESVKKLEALKKEIIEDRDDLYGD